MLSRNVEMFQADLKITLLHSLGLGFPADTDAARLNDDKATQNRVALLSSQLHKRASNGRPSRERITQQHHAAMGRSTGVDQLPEVPIFRHQDARVAPR